MASRTRTIVLDVPVFGQRDAECGNTSLKALLWPLGIRRSAAELGRLAGLTSAGIDHGALVTAARRAGAAVFVRDGGSLAELRWFLRRGHPAIVGWWTMAPGDRPFDAAWSLAERRERDCGHYSVIAGIDATRVLMMDPQWISRRGRLRIVGHRWLPIPAFRRVWYDTDGPRYRPVSGWYLVAHRGDERFAPQLGGGRDLPPLGPRAARRPV